MIRYFYILSFLFVSLALLAQQNSQPQRTAADIALKQTEMLVRELGITDSVLHDTLYLMHLKYAKLRELSNTRQEAIQRMQQMQDELKRIIGEELYSVFMSRQVGGTSRIPKHACNWIVSSQVPTDTLSSTNVAPQIPAEQSPSQL